MTMKTTIAHLGALCVLACGINSFGGAASVRCEEPPKSPPAEVRKAPSKTAWLTPAAGLEKATKERHPIIAIWPGKEAEATWLTFEREYFAASTFQKEIERFIAVRIERGDDAALPTGVGALEDRSAILLFDFRGEIVHRWDGETPARMEVVKVMRKTIRRSEELALQYATVEQLVEKGSYALKLGKCRDAVQSLLEGEKIGLAVGSPPAESLKRFRAAIEEAYAQRIEQAEKAETAKKLSDALEHYQKMRHDFPLPERVQELERNIGRIMRLLGMQE